MRGSDFIFHCANSLYHKCIKINFKRGGSHVDSPESIKKKKKQKILNMMMLDAFNVQKQSCSIMKINHIKREFQTLNHL